MFSNYNQILNSCEGKYEIVRNLRDADWCIFPYCSCNEKQIELLKEELNQILKFKKSECKVIVTGCICFVKEEKRKFLEEYNIDYLVPVDNQVEEICEILGVTPSGSVYNRYQIVGEIKIAEGCLNKCSFCRIHYSNRALKSVPIEVIENQVKDLVSRGIKFIRLTGLNTTQYGIDSEGKKMLPTLLQRLSKIAGVEGIEVLECSLSDVDDEIANEICYNEKIIGITIDMQSGSDPTLKRMDVGHNVAKIKKYFPMFREKILFTRIISGFPGETMKDVCLTLDLLEELQIYNIGISEYCNSKDTPAGKMEQLLPMRKQMHDLMYKVEAKKLYNDMINLNNGNKYIGYISEISLKSVKVYCPGDREIIMHKHREEDYMELKLRDKVEVLLENGEYSLVRVIESSPIDTEFPKESTNKLVDLLTNLNKITSDFALPHNDLLCTLQAIYLIHGGNELGVEEFKAGISNLPEVLQEAIMNIYQSVHRK